MNDCIVGWRIVAAGFFLPPQVAVILKVNGGTSQAGLALSVTH
ncbi:MAG TPA: hypothetical protein VNY05_45520 [Candidatus Acidoferrales bacterium]|nr:hypothetical protein [Candidatus Acidoferrales bacterium]